MEGGENTKGKNERKRVNVLVVCADGVATSSIVLVSLREALEDMDVEAEFTQGRVLDVTRTVKGGNFDFVVSTAGVALDDTDIPVISGIPFLTGIGKEQVFEQIKDIIDKK